MKVFLYATKDCNSFEKEWVKPVFPSRQYLNMVFSEEATKNLLYPIFLAVAPKILIALKQN